MNTPRTEALRQQILADGYAGKVNNISFRLDELCCQLETELSACQAKLREDDLKIGKLVSLYDKIYASSKAAEARAEKMEKALRDAVEVIRTWHNMGGAEDVWGIYFDNAPELTSIRAALSEGKP